MRFAIYSRKSVFTGRGESVENQVELCRRYILSSFPAAGEGDITVYEDEGFSGKDLNRPQFRRMMADLRRSPPDCVVCYRLDRISRNVGDFARLIEGLNRRGVALVCIREKFDTSTPMGKAMMYIASVFAQLERETLAERVRDNMRLLAASGRWLGGTPPTGYRSEQVRELILDGRIKTSCRLREAPGELAAVRAAFQAMLEVRTLRGACRRLAEEGVAARTGRPFTLSGLHSLLENPVYCAADGDAWDYFASHGAQLCAPREAWDGTRGLLAYNKRDCAGGRAPRNPVEKWIVAAGRHPALIPGERWVAVQRLLDGGGGPRPAVHNDRALLSGLLRCARCGGRMFAKRRTGAGRTGEVFDYICQNKLRPGAAPCGGQNLHGGDTDRAVWDALRPWLAQVLEGGGSPLPALARQRRRELAEECRRPGAPDRSPPPPELQALAQSLARPGEQLSRLSPEEQRALVRLLAAECRWDGTAVTLTLRWE